MSEHLTYQDQNRRLAIVCAADDRFSLPMAIMLYSALQNYRGLNVVDVYVLDAGISPAHQEKVRRTLSSFAVNLNWLEPNANALRDLPLKKSRLTLAAYYRLLIPEILPSYITTAVYLDSDILVELDLARLTENDLGTAYFLAVQDRKKLISGSQLALCPALKAHLNEEYFNSGVMLMNLNVMREDNVASLAIDFARQYPEYIGGPTDQDALNAVSFGRWEKLDATYNLFVSENMSYKPGSILHFIGRRKPWRHKRERPYQSRDFEYAHKLYLAYMRESGWFSPMQWLCFSAVDCFQTYIGNNLRRHFVTLRLTVLSLLVRIRNLIARKAASQNKQASRV